MDGLAGAGIAGRGATVRTTAGADVEATDGFPCDVRCSDTCGATGPGKGRGRNPVIRYISLFVRLFAWQQIA